MAELDILLNKGDGSLSPSEHRRWFILSLSQHIEPSPVLLPDKWRKYVHTDDTMSVSISL